MVVIQSKLSQHKLATTRLTEERMRRIVLGIFINAYEMQDKDSFDMITKRMNDVKITVIPFARIQGDLLLLPLSMSEFNANSSKGVDSLIRDIYVHIADLNDLYSEDNFWEATADHGYEEYTEEQKKAMEASIGVVKRAIHEKAVKIGKCLFESQHIIQTHTEEMYILCTDAEYANIRYFAWQSFGSDDPKMDLAMVELNKIIETMDKL